jgi:broad specificity phosphatase PhoE
LEGEYRGDSVEGSNPSLSARQLKKPRSERGFCYTNPMSVTITYFVHGTTTDNETHLATGWLPGELSEKGREQAEDLGNQAKDKHFDVVFCSDLQRAVDSAELGFGGTYQIIQDNRLRECNYGDENGRTHTFKDSMENFVDMPFPNGESYKDVEVRMKDFIAFLKENYDGKHVAIVAHQAPQLALDVLLRGRNWNQAITEDWRRTKAFQPGGWEYIAE